MPTTWPLSLIAVAAEVESPGKGRSSVALIFPLLPSFGFHSTDRRLLGRVLAAGRIGYRRLRPANHVARVVDSGGEAMVSAEGGQLPHEVILPHEAATEQVGRLGQEAHQLAGPVLVQRVVPVG